MHELRFEYLLSGVEAVFGLADALQGIATPILIRIATDSTSEREIATAQLGAAVDALGADANSDHEESEEVGELHFDKFAEIQGS